jgi:hypothetical protein
VSLSRHTILSAVFAVVLSVLVIVVADYYESRIALLFQILLIGGPTLAAFMVLPKSGILGIIGWIVIASLVTAGWAHVAYIDTRPYTGGGASLAPLFGWFTCFVAFVIAALIRALDSRLGRLRGLGDHTL